MSTGFGCDAFIPQSTGPRFLRHPIRETERFGVVGLVTQEHRDQISVLEAMDAASATAFAGILPPREADSLGVRTRRVGGASAIMAHRIDVLMFNRVIGLGVEEPARPEILDELIAWYRETGTPRFFVQLAPGAEPSLLPEWLGSRGLFHYNNWVKLTRTTEEQPRIVTDLTVERIGAGRSHEFAAIVARGFGLPDATRPWISATVGRPAWRHYLALDEGAPVAGGALYVEGTVGWLGFAATDPAHRGRGAQSALLARRIADAKTLGVKRLVVETAEDTTDRRAPSFHNLRRLGFELAYVRPNYLWKAEPVVA